MLSYALHGIPAATHSACCAGQFDRATIGVARRGAFPKFMWPWLFKDADQTQFYDDIRQIQCVNCALLSRAYAAAAPRSHR